MPDAGGLPYPIDPDQTSAWLDAQRKQQIAQMLMSSMSQANQTPASWDSMKVVPKRGALQNLSVLADALLARKGLDASNQATMNYMNPKPAGAPTGPGAGIISADASPQDQASAQQVSNMSPGSGLVQQPRPNPMVPAGMTPQQAQQLYMRLGPQEYAKLIVAPQYAPLEIRRQLTSAHIDPDSPEGTAYQQALLAKNARDQKLVRPDETLVDAATANPLFTAPGGGINTTWQDGKPVQAPIEGAPAATSTIAGAKTAGTQAQTPVPAGVSASGEQLYKFVTPPAAAGTAPAGGASSVPQAPKTASPAEIESQKSGAQGGQTYAAELAKNATGATEVRRSIAEMKNLAAQATPSAANEAKAKLGAFMIAAGADPSTVSKWTGVDIGALQAAQKQTATLAVNSIHSMTSRGTNFDLDTFMRNNPNLNLADPAAFSRVADYMNNKASQDIAKQKDFAQGLKTRQWGTPDMWETNHSAHWLELQNQDIDKGLSNSKTPPPTLAELQAEARRRGLVK
jgi:hypothetical protein